MKKNLLSVLTLAAAMLLRYSFDLAAEADCIERAVSAVLDKGYRTADIMPGGASEPPCKRVGCREMGTLIRKHLTKE